MIFVGMQGLGAATKDPNVEELQRALNALAAFTKDSRYQVTVDGLVGPLTLAATTSAATLVTAYISDTLAKAAVLGLTALAIFDPPKAEAEVKKHASKISKAIFTYIAAKTATGTSTTTTPTTSKPPLRQLDPRIFLPTTPGTPPGFEPSVVVPNRIFAYDKKARVYRVAQSAAPLQGEAPPFVEIGVSTDRPTDATEVRFYDYLVAIGRLPWYRKWWGIALLGVGATAVVVGTVTVVRKKKSGNSLKGTSDSVYTYHGTTVEPIPGTVRRVAGGIAVDVRVTDPRSTVKHATVNADNIIDKYGRRYLK